MILPKLSAEQAIKEAISQHVYELNPFFGTSPLGYLVAKRSGKLHEALIAYLDTISHESTIAKLIEKVFVSRNSAQDNDDVIQLADYIINMSAIGKLDYADLIDLFGAIGSHTDSTTRYNTLEERLSSVICNSTALIRGHTEVYTNDNDRLCNIITSYGIDRFTEDRINAIARIKQLFGQDSIITITPPTEATTQEETL